MRNSLFSLEGKVAVVTGAARGLGRAIARTFATQGARLALIDREAAELAVVAGDIGGSARAYPADLEEVDKIPALVESIRNAEGGIDILVNNAGICPRLSFLDSKPTDWDRLMAINARSQFFLMQAVHPVMKARGGGRIINVASTGGRTGSFANASIYSGTKGAIVMFTKSVAREVAADGVLVNCVAPGIIDTDLVRNLPAEKRDALRAQIPLKRFGSPEEIASVFVFLASSECSYVTGATFDINGGWLML